MVPGGASRYAGSTKMLVGLPGSSSAPQQKSVGTRRGTQGELIKGEDLTAGIQDAATSRLGDSQSTDSEFGEFEQTSVIGDGSNNDSYLVFLSLGEASQLDEGHGGLAGPAHA